MSRHKGYKHSEETKLKMSMSKKGKSFTLQHREKIRQSHTGIMTDEWKKKIKEGRLNSFIERNKKLGRSYQIIDNGETKTFYLKTQALREYRKIFEQNPSSKAIFKSIE